MVRELIERLEKAKGPDRKLDVRIHCAGHGIDPVAVGIDEIGIPGSGWTPYRDEWPTYTASIDAALTLVPEGCDFYFEVEQVMGGFCNYLYVTGGGALAPSHDLRHRGGKLHPTWKEAVAALPREILATALKAREAMAHQGEQ